MDNYLPWYRQIRFKLIWIITAVLLIAFAVSHYIDHRFTKGQMEHLIKTQFTTTANIVENFIDFVGQSGLITAKALAADPNLHRLLSADDSQAVVSYFSSTLEKISADTTILLDNRGYILAADGYPEASGNLRSLELVRQTLATGQPDFAIVQDMGTFILYTSAPVLRDRYDRQLTDKHERQTIGIVLVGYAMNNSFVDNLKKNTAIDIAIVRDRSVIAGTLEQNGKRLNTIPVPFTEYQMVLNNPDHLFQSEINGTMYYLKAVRLRAMQQNMSGSLLMAYSQQNFKQTLQLLENQHLILIGVSLVIIIITLLLFSRKLLAPVSELVKATIQINRGDLATRSTINGRDEFGLLGTQFNKMVEGLQQKDEALRQANRELEEQVESRTRELDEKNSLLDSILYTATDLAIAATDEKLQVKFFNPEAEQLFQVDSHKVIGQNVAHLHQRFHVPSDKFGEALQSLEHHQSHSFTFRLPIGDHQKLIEATISALWSNDEQQTGYVLLAKDITSQTELAAERKKLEEQLNRGQKMEAIGLMAGGIAHDLNNILSGIIGYPELLLRDLPQNSRLRKPIEAIKQSGQRASAVVADLLTVARGVAAAKEVTNLNTLILEHLNSPEHQNLITQHQGVVCKTALEPGLARVSCSRVHIKKSLLNLILNAIEAIDEDGLITIATRNYSVRKTDSGTIPLPEGEYVLLSVTDNGQGINNEDLAKIFEPFYSKKVLGRSGTGLGLTVVWNTIEDHSGHISVESSDSGSCFEVYLPASEAEEEEDSSTANRRLDEIHGHGESILVIDDEPMQRDLACKFLSTLGYNPDSVKSGEEAVDFLGSRSVDLLILDMKMDPGIDGHQTYQRITEKNPHQKAIIASGFSEDDKVKQTLDLGAGQFIKKPYSLHQLGLAVQRELKIYSPDQPT
ncbi:MAG: response regulator [Thermodesulfobacteriota bacterium]